MTKPMSALASVILFATGCAQVSVEEVRRDFGAAHACDAQTKIVERKDRRASDMVSEALANKPPLPVAGRADGTVAAQSRAAHDLLDDAQVFEIEGCGDTQGIFLCHEAHESEGRLQRRTIDSGFVDCYKLPSW